MLDMLGYTEVDWAMTDLHSDIEKIREVSDKLMDPELALRVFENAWDAQVIVNDQGMIQLVNAQTELLFGYLRKELYDKDIRILLPEALRERHREHIQKYVIEPRVRPMGENLQLKARHSTGREFEVLVHLYPIQWRDGLLVVATIRRK